MNKRNCLAAACLLALASCQTAQVAATETPVCNALRMYANGIISGGCARLGDPSQNLWVCELPGAPPNTDVHTTFNARVPLHLTVRLATGCSDNTNLNGSWPTLALASPNPLCGVIPVPFATALNAIPQTFTARAGFPQAGEAGLLTQQEVTGWMQLVRNNRCP